MVDYTVERTLLGAQLVGAAPAEDYVQLTMWAVMQSTGIKSEYASASAVAAVGHSRPGCNQAHPGPSGRPGAPVGHEGGALLVAGRDVLDPLRPPSAQ